MLSIYIFSKKFVMLLVCVYVYLSRKNKDIFGYLRKWRGLTSNFFFRHLFLFF